MIRLIFDENFNGKAIKGLQRRMPELDAVRAQAAGLQGVSDPKLLEWAAQESRVVVTHDAKTLIGFAYEQINQGKQVAGVIEVRDDMPVSQMIEEIMMCAIAGEPDDFINQVRYIPL